MFEFLKRKKEDEVFSASEESDEVKGFEPTMPSEFPAPAIERPSIFPSGGSSGAVTERDIQLILTKMELINNKIEELDNKIDEVLEIARQSK
jgi:hypothetical protein